MGLLLTRVLVSAKVNNIERRRRNKLPNCSLSTVHLLSTIQL